MCVVRVIDRLYHEVVRCFAIYLIFYPAFIIFTLFRLDRRFRLLQTSATLENLAIACLWPIDDLVQDIRQSAFLVDFSTYFVVSGLRTLTLPACSTWSTVLIFSNRESSSDLENRQVWGLCCIYRMTCTTFESRSACLLRWYIAYSACDILSMALMSLSLVFFDFLLAFIIYGLICDR